MQTEIKDGRQHYTIKYDSIEDWNELLAVVKTGDSVTYLEAHGSESPIKANITMLWNDALDRPQEREIKIINFFTRVTLYDENGNEIK